MQMYTNCPVCDLQYEVEPGFFWGSMYISYAVTVAISAITAIIVYFFPLNATVGVYIGSIVTALVVFAPYNFRLSRALMLYLFSPVQFDPSAAKEAMKSR